MRPQRKSEQIVGYHVNYTDEGHLVIDVRPWNGYFSSEYRRAGTRQIMDAELNRIVANSKYPQVSVRYLVKEDDVTVLEICESRPQHRLNEGVFTYLVNNDRTTYTGAPDVYDQQDGLFDWVEIPVQRDEILESNPEYINLSAIPKS